jgi:hypothetical protein
MIFFNLKTNILTQNHKKNVGLLVTWSDKRRSENRGHKDKEENKRNAIQLTKIIFSNLIVMGTCLQNILKSPEEQWNIFDISII